MSDQATDATREHTGASAGSGNRFLMRPLAASAIVATLGALVVCDLWVGGFRAWWERHSITGSIVSNLLVVGVTALIVDEVIARRQRKERAVSVAVQGLIVYGQTRRTYDAVVAAIGGEAAGKGNGAADEMRSLANMLLVVSASLFDDRVARLFLTEVQRLAGSMYRALASTTPSSPGLGSDGVGPLRAERLQVDASIKPLAERIPSHYRAGFEEQTGPAAPES